MTKEEIIKIAEGLGYVLDLDRFDAEGQNWMRFELPDFQDDPDLRWIWQRSFPDKANFTGGGNILFKAGQKAFRQKLDEFVDL